MARDADPIEFRIVKSSDVPRYLSRAEAVRFLGLDRGPSKQPARVLDQLRRSGRLPAVLRGKRHYYAQNVLEVYRAFEEECQRIRAGLGPMWPVEPP